MESTPVLELTTEDISEPIWEALDGDLFTIYANRFDSCGSGSCLDCDWCIDCYGDECH